jgi:cytoskeletal protein RodZ
MIKLIKFIVKLVKWAVIAFLALVLVVAIAAMVIPNPKVSECIATYGEKYCDYQGNALDKATVDAKEAEDKLNAAKEAAAKAAEEAAAKAAEEVEDKLNAAKEAAAEEAAAEEAAAKAAEEAAAKAAEEVEDKLNAAKEAAAATEKAAADARANIESTLTSYCFNTIKSQAVYPTKVDFSLIFGTDTTVYENFNGTAGKPNRYMMRTTGEMMNTFGNMVPFTASCKVDFNNNEYSLVEVLIN